MIVYLARDIPAFVMYCVNGESGSSLLIESSLLLDTTEVLARVLGPVEGEEQLHIQLSMLRRKTRRGMFLLPECFCYLLCWEVWSEV